MSLMHKVPHTGAFFVFFSSLFIASYSSAFSACSADAFVHERQVSQVFDGDTLGLADDRPVRLIGINTPEIGRDGKRDEPGAAAALEGLRKIIIASNNRILLIPGEQGRDRYGRMLAHVYDQQGNNISELLLRQGLGFALSIPPNLRHLDCYKRAEMDARNADLGLWTRTSYPLEAQELAGQEQGFHLLRGHIQRIGKSRRALWLNLEQGPALRIDWQDWDHFKGMQPADLLDKHLEVRGWLYRRKGQQRMQVRHPSYIQWLD
jgi:endonuclease YncB( thermonuclease family)